MNARCLVKVRIGYSAQFAYVVVGQVAIRFDLGLQSH